MPVVLLGTLDTKGTELLFVRDLLLAGGASVLVVDAGTQAHGTPCDIPASEVFRAAGGSLDAVRAANDRGQAVALAAQGATKVVERLHADGKVEGILGLGGSAGTTIASAAMRALPYGVPKVLVSTLASGQVRPYVGVRDIFLLYSVVDIAGLNRISRTILTRAAQAMLGMVLPRVTPPPVATEKPLLTATMFGVTTPCVQACRVTLEEAGNEVLVFHATGSGGQTMEAMIRDGLVVGVLDITTTELADELVGGVLSAGPDRLTAASLAGVPQVISLGALDMVNFGPPETVPEKFRQRRFYQHNPTVTLMRTTPEENDALGKEIAHKASASRGPVAVLVPLRGVSALDAEGKAFWWPEADRALFDSLRLWMGPQVKLIELDLHINDPAFAQVAVTTLRAMLAATARSPG
jgi:uncharacterized protein (UPF0261 family)